MLYYYDSLRFRNGPVGPIFSASEQVHFGEMLMSILVRQRRLSSHFLHDFQRFAGRRYVQALHDLNSDESR